MRRNLLLTAILTVFAVAAVSAQSQMNEADGYRLLVAPDRADGSYGRGDEVRFLVSFEKDGAPVADGEADMGGDQRLVETQDFRRGPRQRRTGCDRGA